MIHLLSIEKQTYFKANIISRPWNWGAIKGGKACFEKHKDEIIGGLRTGFNEKFLKSEREQWYRFMENPLSTELCEFIGAVIGDGCITASAGKRTRPLYCVNITGDAKLDKNYLTNTLPAIIERLFNITPCIYFRKKKRAMTLNFHSKMLFKMFTNRFNFVSGNKTFSVTIPDEILLAGSEFIFATTRGIFDTDGCVFFDLRKKYKKPYPRITLNIVSQPLFIQLKDFLSKYFSLYTQHNVKRNSYYVEVYGHKQFEKWMRLIGFSNQRHLSRIRGNYELRPGVEPGTSSLPMTRSEPN